MLLRFHGDRWEEISINRQINHDEGGNGDVTETAAATSSGFRTSEDERPQQRQADPCWST